MRAGCDIGHQHWSGLDLALRIVVERDVHPLQRGDEAAAGYIDARLAFGRAHRPGVGERGRAGLLPRLVARPRPDDTRQTARASCRATVGRCVSISWVAAS